MDMTNSRNRIIIGGVCIVIIISMIIYLILNWSEVFVNKVEVVYPDGCIEKFENGVAVTPICTNGRLLKEEEERKYIESNAVKPITFPEGDFFNTVD